VTLDAMKNYAQAIEDYNKALALDPKFTDAYLNEGLAYIRQSDIDGAIGCFNKVLTLDAKNAAAYYNRSIAYYYKKDFKQSWADVHKAEDLGAKISTDLLENLKSMSGREK